MKIALVTHYYNSHKGGVEIAAFNTAKNLISGNNNIEIIWCAADCDNSPKNNLNFTSAPLKSSNFIENILPFPYPVIFPSGIMKLKKIVKKSDIIHIHDFLYMSNLFAFFFAKLCKKPVLITQHIGFIPYKNPLLRFVLQTLNKTLGKFILSKADSVVFISKNVLKYFSEICRKTSHFKYYPNPADTTIYKVYNSDERNKFRNDYIINKFTFLFVGRFTEKKGLEIIKKLAEKFQDCDFVFAGWGQINPNDWKFSNVKVFSGLAGEKIAELYNAADALILPSYGEGFPLVVQEALACGLDILISEEILRAEPEISPFVKAVYENSENFENFVKQIQNFLEEYDYSYSSRNEKSEFVKSKWELSINRNNYLQLLKELSAK